MEKSVRGQQSKAANEPKASGLENQQVSAAPVSASNLPAATAESVKLMAESIGIGNLNDEAAKEIVTDLTFTIKSIILVKCFQLK